MALRRSRSPRGGDSGQKKGFAERIAAATKPEPSRLDVGEVPAVLNQGLTRYQRRTANLPSGATPLTVEERTNIVIDLRNSEDATDEEE
jgi:hypothetical protein